jgi:integrase
MSSQKITPMAATAKVTFNAQRKRKDGTCALYLRVIINRIIRNINLDVHWWPDRFQDGKCVGLSKDDRSAHDNNLILSDALSRATEIFIQYRLRRMTITMEAFMREFTTNMNKDDFLKYYEWKVMQRLKDREIEYSTKLSHMVTLRILRKWKRWILFNELDDRTAHRFDKWMQKYTGAKSLNGRWGHHRNFKTYLNLARQDRIEFRHPYEYFSAKMTVGRHQPLTKAQFLYIWLGYHNGTFEATERETVRAFLFCCLTGMRHGDVRQVALDWIDGDFFSFVPQKTKRHGTVVRVPASTQALDLIADEMDEVGKEPMFRRISEQKQNEAMRQIGKDLHLKHNLCFQVARETFATLYMENDGKLEVLASFLGHTSTKMSEKYVKIRDQRRKSEGVKIGGFTRED